MKEKKKGDRKQVILRLPEEKLQKLKRYVATQSMVTGRSVTMQKVLEAQVDALITPATLLPSSETEKVEEA